MKEKNGLFSRLWDMPYGRTNPHLLFDAAKNSKEFVQKLQLQIKIPVHNGCVNSISWNDNGKYLLSGSDDQRLSIVHGYDYSVLAYVATGHRANIFSAKFLPSSGDAHVVSCSGDGIIIYSNLERPETSMNNKFNCHKGTAYEIMTVPNDPNSFLSCGEDRTVRWFDVRTKTSCSNEDCKDDILINCRSPVTSLAVNPLTPYQLAVGCADASVQIYDRRMLATQATGGTYSNSFKALMTCFTVSEFTQSRRITSLCYSADGQEMLVSYSSDYIYLFDIRGDLEKKPRLLSRNPSSNGSDSDSGFFFRGRPLMKRLRVRGDWSDTGPNARPEAETRSESQETPSQTNIVQRMTDILTRMFNSSSQTRTRSVASQSSSGSSHVSSPSEGDVDGVSDSNEEEGAQNSAEEKVKNENTKTVGTGNDAGPSKPPKNSKYEGKSDKRTNFSKPPSSSSAFEQEKPGPSFQNTVLEPGMSGASSKCENQSVITGVCENTHASDSEQTFSETGTLNLQNEEKLESRGKDLSEKHHSEPMGNLHSSDQSDNPVTMDVASSSAADDVQRLEQPVPELPDLPPTEGSREFSHTIEMLDAHRLEGASSESETEAAIQRIYPNDFAPVITNVRSLGSSSSLTETSGGAAESEVELMMEVDSWDVDRDQSDQSWDTERDQATRSWDRDRDRASQLPSSQAPTRGTRRSSCDRLSDSFLCSLEDEVEARNEDIPNEDSHVVNVSQPKVKKKFTGHRNARTMIKESTFWGDNFIMSGSDCGHIFIWDRHTAELVMLMEADHHVVNCLQPHPFDPILASSGIDYDIKLWAPLQEEPLFDLEKANEIIKRNEIMLKETKDTITVPASFMFRMLALSHFRTGRAYRWSRAIREMHSANSDSST